MSLFWKNFFAVLIFIFYEGNATTEWSWTAHKSTEQAEETQDTEAALDSTIQKMHEEFQELLYMSSPADENQIVELVVGPTHFLPENFISLKMSNGKKYKFKTASALVHMLKSYQDQHTQGITHTTFSGVTFNNDFVRLLRAVNSGLWTGGMIQVVGCDFGMLSDAQIGDLFRKTLKPTSLSLVDSIGLSSDVLNTGIRDHLFGDSLAIIGDSKITGQLQLDPDVLVRFLHEPEGPPKHAILTVNPAYIDGGGEILEAKIVERFLTNHKVSFHVGFTSNIKLPLLSDNPRYDTFNNELLSQEELDLGPVKRTIIKRQRKQRDPDDL
ncbi:hypothetical protein Ddc_14941 [Ditylenchus destructor]|nr:hypothetical protein Ddc_14941 [Ditylenchus destructor]